jgi:phosphohistidine phosphatase
MKTLYLIRHAKSSWEDPTEDDFSRTLNHRGKKDAPKMAKRLKEKKVFPDVLISSPAVRAKLTCLEFAKVFDFKEKKIIWEPKLYHASEDTILQVINELEDHPRDQEEIVLLFGHNPGITLFANAIFNTSIMNIPTCGIVGGHLNIKKWGDARFGCGHLAFTEFPKE